MFSAAYTNQLIYISQYNAIELQLIGVFCDGLNLGSTAAHDCQIGQNKGRYGKEEVLFLLISLKKVKATGRFSRIFFPS